MLAGRICFILLIALYGVSASVGRAETGGSSSSVTAVIDTTLGRLRCTLFEKERPKLTAEFIGLAEGTAFRPDATSGVMKRGKPFYEGARMYSIPAGISAGSNVALQGVELPWETAPKLKFDRPGRLGMRPKKGQAGGTEFMILDHANSEDDGENATVFGQCDEASIAVVTAISHQLAMVDNMPEKPIAVNRILIVRNGMPMPPLAPDVPAALVTPAVKPWPKLDVPAPVPTGPTAVIETSMGELRCRLFTKESPIAAAVFMGLATGTKDWKNSVTQQVQHGTRFYDGMIFDRVIPDFVIQSGDFIGDISGATDIGFHFNNEQAPGLSFDRPGRLAFGNNGPDTNNSEIFISEHPMRRLDGGFTIIGQCDARSIGLVERIARVPRAANNRPIKPVTIKRIHFDSH